MTDDPKSSRKQSPTPADPTHLPPENLADHPSDASPAEPWYRDGLKFRCTQCGDCCTGAPGFVWVDDPQLQAIADFLGESIGAARIAYTKLARGRVTLRDYPNGDCVFLDPRTRGCRIYPVRPTQCQTWPFWRSNIESPAAWQSVCEICPGSGKGDLIALREIERRAAQDETL